MPNFADKTVWTGGNLDILRGINSDCVDLIYLDPRFNSNRNYAAPWVRRRARRSRWLRRLELPLAFRYDCGNPPMGGANLWQTAMLN